MTQAVPKTYPRPVSEWLIQEKAIFEKMLSMGKYDVLVVPFQVSGWAVDRATRSAMTAELAAAIARSQKATVPDPYLVAKALGDGQRQLDSQDIYRLANALGVKRVVWGYAGHDRKGNMTVSILAQDNVASMRNGVVWTGPTVSKTFENIAVDDETPAIQQFESLLPDLLWAIGVEPIPVVFGKADNRPVKLDLPGSPKMLLESESSPARDAYTFLLLGLLTPQAQEKTKEKFAEKALLALTRLSPTSPDYRVLRARTFMALGLRMAAIKVLGAPRTDEERELLAALNGNLPEVRALVSKEKNPFKRLIQKLDENRIAANYWALNQKTAYGEVAALHLPGDIWPFIATRAFLDWDIWSQFDNGQLKLVLDQELPIKGYGLKDMVGGVVALGDPAKQETAVSLSIVNHGRKFLEGNAATWCCARAFDRPGVLDYLELVQVTGHSNLMRRIDFLNAIQGRSESAMRFVNSIDAVYKDYPQYAYERAKVEERLARNAGAAEKEGLLKASYLHAFNAMYWEQGQSWLSTAAANLQIGRTAVYGHHDNFYYTDLPFRPNYWSWAKGGVRQAIHENEVASLKNATSEVSALSSLFSLYRRFYPLEKRATELLKSMDGRFIGAPQRYALFASDAVERGDLVAAQGFYRDNIRVNPLYWRSYEALGTLLFKAGDVDAAGKVYLSYPGFKHDSGESRVVLANEAFEAGSRFYWSGHFDLAKALYRISAAQNTGAASEMTSALRLKLLDGDIDSAMVGSMERAQRYNDSYAYRDFLGMLHAKGQSKYAWEGFGQLVRETQQPHVWETALVGHHMAGASEAEVVKWAQQSEFKDAGAGKNAAAAYVLRFASTDRIPSNTVADAIHGLDPSKWNSIDAKKNVIRAPGDSGHCETLAPGAGGFQTPHAGGPAVGYGRQVVCSDLAYFAQAYRAMKLTDYKTAKAIFDDSAKHYAMTELTSYMLPYYALAAAKAGDITGVENKLGTVVLGNQGFYYQLAKAVLAGVAGNNDQAFQFLKLARYSRPHTEDRPLLTQYTFGEIAELMAVLTGDQKIQRLALEWAQKSQKFEPWQSWSYAMEAKLTKNPGDRQRALAMTQYLDPQSERLSAFGKAEIDAAVNAYKGINPFLKRAADTGKEKPI